jgi:hypothetical protein
MNEQLIKFIELCLTDGVITDKEREVIFRKAAEYNVDIDECEIILESMIQQKNMSQTVTILKNEIVTEVNTEINNSEKNSSLLSIYSNIQNLWIDDKYLECINEVKKAESLFKDLFKDSVTARNYLWSLMQVDVEKAYEEIDRVTNIVEDKSKLQTTLGHIYQDKGTKTNDLTILNKALHCFKSHDYNRDSSYGEEKVEELQEIINRIVSNSNKELVATKVFSGKSLNQEKLKSLGVNSEIIKQFTNNDYKKLWKVSCLITEPYYNIKNTISSWQNSNPNFFIPSNGIINEKGAVAFIKANWTNIYVYRVDKYWEKKGSNCDKFKSFDKTKIEIIEINEIV